MATSYVERLSLDNILRKSSNYWRFYVFMCANIFQMKCKAYTRKVSLHLPLSNKLDHLTRRYLAAADSCGMSAANRVTSSLWASATRTRWSSSEVPGVCPCTSPTRARLDKRRPAALPNTVPYKTHKGSYSLYQ